MSTLGIEKTAYVEPLRFQVAGAEVEEGQRTSGRGGRNDISGRETEHGVL